MGLVIDDADPVRGVPETLHRVSYGTVWRRPEGDEWADTLPDLAWTHRCKKSRSPGGNAVSAELSGRVDPRVGGKERPGSTGGRLRENRFDHAP